SRAGEPERERAFGQRRLLPDARGEVGVRAAEPVGDRARDGLDRRFELVVDGQRPPRDTGHELDRAVVVRRTEPARDETEIGRERLAERGLEVVRRVSHDGDAPWLEPQPHGFGREERPVAVLPLPANELRARDDDRRPGAAQAVVRVIRRAVTTNVVPAGSSTRLPFTRTVTFCGARSASWSERPTNDWCCPRSSVPE